MTTFIPYGNASQMTFASIQPGAIVYASETKLKGVSAPTKTNQVLMTTGTGSSSSFIYSYVTPLSMGLTSNKNQIYYSTDNTIRSMELPIDPTTAFAMTYTPSTNTYSMKSITGSFNPMYYEYTLFTPRNNSVIPVSNLNLNTLYNSSNRDTLVTFDKLIPTHSYQITTTLRMWLNDYTAINPPNDCTVLDFKENYASRVTIECTLGDKTDIIFDTMIGNIAMQEYQVTQTKVMPCNIYGSTELFEPVYILNSSNNGGNGLILEPYIAAIDITIVEIPNTVYIGMQPVMQAYTVTGTIANNANPIVIASSNTTGLLTNSKINWVYTSNLSGSGTGITLSSGNSYIVTATMNLFINNPGRLSAPAGYTALQWKENILPTFTLKWNNFQGNTLILAKGLYANIATICYQIYGSLITPVIESDITTIDLSLEVGNYGKPLVNGDWTGLISSEIITPFITLTIIQI